MSESDVLQGKHALDILQLCQTLICLDQVLDNTINIINIILVIIG